MNALTEMLLRQLGGSAISQIGGKIGADPSTTSKAMAIAVPFGFLGAFERLRDRAPDDELAPEDAHRGAHRLAHHGFPRAGDKAAQRLTKIPLSRLRVKQTAGQHQSPG